jgi:phosphopantetheinyl transferase
VFLARFSDNDRAQWVAAAEHWLPIDERQHADELKNPDVRALHIIGRSIVRILAAAQLGSDPRRVEVAVLDDGKPVLRNAGDLHISVAHTGQIVAVASTHGVDVGVDIELPTDATLSPQRIAKRLLAPEEAEHVGQFSGAAAARELVRYWTIKEAVGKALGIRLIPALSAIELRPEGEVLRLVRVSVGPPADMWSVYQAEVEDGDEVLAVAVPAPGARMGPVGRFDHATLRAGHPPE